MPEHGCALVTYPYVFKKVIYAPDCTVRHAVPLFRTCTRHFNGRTVPYRSQTARLLYRTCSVPYADVRYGSLQNRTVKILPNLFMYHLTNQTVPLLPYRTVQKLWHERPGREEGREEAGPEKAPALQILVTNQRENQVVSEKPLTRQGAKCRISGKGGKWLSAPISSLWR